MLLPRFASDPCVLPQHMFLLFILLSSIIVMVEVVGANVNDAYGHQPHNSNSQKRRTAHQLTSDNDPLALNRIGSCGFIPLYCLPIGQTLEEITKSPNKLSGASLNYITEGMTKFPYHENDEPVDRGGASSDRSDSKGSNSTSDESFMLTSPSSSVGTGVPLASRHYACPPTTLEALRKRYGYRRTIWGEWSNREARVFYRTQLPRALQIDGALGLTLEERAQLASEARHALRMYSRERCRLPGRLVARLYDGMRHLIFFGSWAPDGMTWMEVKQKYSAMARSVLPADQACDPDIVELYVYRKIVERACSTNPVFDKFAECPLDFIAGKLTLPQLKDLVHSSIVEDSIVNAIDVFEDLMSGTPPP